MKYNYKKLDEVNKTSEELKLQKLITLSLDNPTSPEAQQAIKLAKKLAEKHSIDLEKYLNKNNATKEIDVYQNTINFDVSNYSTKFKALLLQLDFLRSYIPVELYAIKGNKQSGIIIYSNDISALIMATTLVEYIKIMYFKTKDYLCSFVLGVLDNIFIPILGTGLVSIVDDGINASEIKTNIRVKFDEQGYADGSSWKIDNRISERDVIGGEQ